MFNGLKNAIYRGKERRNESQIETVNTQIISSNLKIRQHRRPSVRPVCVLNSQFIFVRRSCNLRLFFLCKSLAVGRSSSSSSLSSLTFLPRNSFNSVVLCAVKGTNTWYLVLISHTIYTLHTHRHDDGQRREERQTCKINANNCEDRAAKLHEKSRAIGHFTPSTLLAVSHSLALSLPRSSLDALRLFWAFWVLRVEHFNKFSSPLPSAASSLCYAKAAAYCIYLCQVLLLLSVVVQFRVRRSSLSRGANRTSQQQIIFFAAWIPRPFNFLGVLCLSLSPAASRSRSSANTTRGVRWHLLNSF